MAADSGGTGTASDGYAVNARYRAIACMLMATLVSACAPIPVKSEKIEQTDQFVARATVDSLVTTGTSREEVLQRFGEPTLRGWQDSAFGYFRCVTFNGDIWSLIFLVPIPSFGGKDQITDCEYLGFWFDGSGRLVKGDMKVMHGLMYMDTGGWSLYENDLKQWLGKHAPEARP